MSRNLDAFSYRWWFSLKCEMMLIWCIFSIFYQFLIYGNKIGLLLICRENTHMKVNRVYQRNPFFQGIVFGVGKMYECSIKKRMYKGILNQLHEYKQEIEYVKILSVILSSIWKTSLFNGMQMGFQLMHLLHYKYKRKFISPPIKELLI